MIPFLVRLTYLADDPLPAIEHGRRSLLMLAVTVFLSGLLTGCTFQPGGNSATLASFQQSNAIDQADADAVAGAAQDKTMQRCTAQGKAIASVTCHSAAGACSAVKLYEVQQMALNDCAGVVAQEKQSITGIAGFFATLGL